MNWHRSHAKLLQIDVFYRASDIASLSMYSYVDLLMFDPSISAISTCLCFFYLNGSPTANYLMELPNLAGLGYY